MDFPRACRATHRNTALARRQEEGHNTYMQPTEHFHAPPTQQQNQALFLSSPSTIQPRHRHAKHSKKAPLQPYLEKLPWKQNVIDVRHAVTAAFPLYLIQ
jgi:hypothetical protein